jgi:hypothetical protein
MKEERERERERKEREGDRKESEKNAFFRSSCKLFLSAIMLKKHDL